MLQQLANINSCLTHAQRARLTLQQVSNSAHAFRLWVRTHDLEATHPETSCQYGVYQMPQAAQTIPCYYPPRAPYIFHLSCTLFMSPLDLFGVHKEVYNTAIAIQLFVLPGDFIWPSAVVMTLA